MLCLPPAPQDVSRVWRVAERLQYGMVGVNEVAITAEVRCSPEWVFQRNCVPAVLLLLPLSRAVGCCS